jgi:hypothetical protein
MEPLLVETWALEKSVRRRKAMKVKSNLKAGQESAAILD